MVHFSGVLRFAHPFGFATTCEAQERLLCKARPKESEGALQAQSSVGGKES